MLKTTRNVEIGWFHNDGKAAKQVRTKQGGGTRKIQLPVDAGIKDILQEGKKLFFPDGISTKGSESDFEFEVWDFKQNCLNNDTCESIGTMYICHYVHDWEADYVALLHCNYAKRT